MPCFLMNHSEICVHFLICPPIQKNSHKHYTFLMQTCQNCVHMQLSTISKCYTLLYKHVKIADYTFSIQMSTISKCCTFTTQTCQNCEHKQNVHYIKHCTLLHFSLQTVHYIKWLHFCYTNMSKLRPYPNVHYINHYTFVYKIAKMSTISNTTICYTFAITKFISSLS